MGETPDQLEWTISDLTETITSDRDGCINHLFGSYMRGGPDRETWSEVESHLHINCLELPAATLAVQCFARHREDIMILLRMDNIIAIAYINKLVEQSPPIT